MPAFLVALALFAPALVLALSAGRAPAGSRFHPGGAAPRAAGWLEAAPSTHPDATPLHHYGATLICEDCHVLHAPATGGGAPEAPDDPARHRILLKASDPLDLCLSCHDGQSHAPDVVGADAAGLTLRSAGHFADPGEPNPRGHDLGRGLPPIPSDYCARCHAGGEETRQVTCIDCHDPHGNGVARNLRWASWPEGTPELGLLTDPGATGMARYEAASVRYGTLDSDALREVTSLCIDCHHVFSGASHVDPDGDGIHELHPSYDSERGSINSIAQGAFDGGSDPGHWTAGTGSGFLRTPRVRFVTRGASDHAGASRIDADANGVFCLTCHFAHGSDQAFGMTYELSGGFDAPGCDQCHGLVNVSAP